MKARRRPVATTAPGEWLRDRDSQVARCIATGLGIRPTSWWLHESPRPDLAEGGDTYVHLREEPGYLDRAKERLRHLARSGELTDRERAAIAVGEGPRCEWRRTVLAERSDQGPDAA